MTAEVQGQFGGLVTVQVGSQLIPPTEAEIMIEPGTLEVSSKANGDGSAAYEQKPKLCGADIKFRDVGDIDWASFVLRYCNVTISEQTNGRTHLFTNTRIIGYAKVNVSTGEVSGLQVSGGTYQRLASS